MPKTFLSPKMAQNLFSPKMARMKISASLLPCDDGMEYRGVELDYRQTSLRHRRRLLGWGQPVHVPPIIERCLCFHQLLLPFFSPNILACPPLYIFFDKSMPVNAQSYYYNNYIILQAYYQLLYSNYSLLQLLYSSRPIGPQLLQLDCLIVLYYIN